MSGNNGFGNGGGPFNGQQGQGSLPPTFDMDGYHKAQQEAGADRLKMFWTPKTDQTWIRFLPLNPPHPQMYYYWETSSHSINGQFYECQRTHYGKTARCPFCEWADMIWARARNEKRKYEDMTEKEKADLKAYQTQKRFSSPILVRGQESELGVVWYSYGINVKKKLDDWTDPKKPNGLAMYGNIFDWMAGRDILIVKSMNAKGYPEYSNSVPAMQASPVGSNEFINWVYNNQPNLMEYLKNRILPYDQLQAILQQGMPPAAGVWQNPAAPVTNQQWAQPPANPAAPPMANIPGVQANPMKVIADILSKINVASPDAAKVLGEWQRAGGKDIDMLRAIQVQFPKMAPANSAPMPPTAATPFANPNMPQAPFNPTNAPPFAPMPNPAAMNLAAMYANPAAQQQAPQNTWVSPAVPQQSAPVMTPHAPPAVPTGGGATEVSDMDALLAQIQAATSIVGDNK
jgi:hypothetical protein